MNPRVIISGIGVVSPYGAGAELLQQNICQGKSAVRRLEHLPHPGAPVAGPRFSGSGKARRMALAAAREAWTDAAPPAGARPALCASIGWDERAERQRLADGENFLEQHFAADGVSFSEKISNFSACAASTMSVGNACRLLAAGQADLVIAGGADSRLHTLGALGYDLLGALARDVCRPFDRDRDGFVMGEGAAFFVLERRADAQRRGAKIYGEILGYAANCDAHRLTDPDPRGTAAAACITLALNRAGLRPAQLDYINAHGTGTVANDAAEIAALTLALGAEAQRIPVSSCKAMLGHCSMAAGALELAAALLALRTGALPPTLNCEHPAWDDYDFVPLPVRKTGAKIFLKNSLGFGGQNACLVVAAEG